MYSSCDASGQIVCVGDRCKSNCTDEEFECGNICLSNKYACDGIKDCPNGEDEMRNCSKCCYGEILMVDVLMR